MPRNKGINGRFKMKVSGSYTVCWLPLQLLIADHGGAQNNERVSVQCYAICYGYCQPALCGIKRFCRVQLNS